MKLWLDIKHAVRPLVVLRFAVQALLAALGAAGLLSAQCAAELRALGPIIGL